MKRMIIGPSPGFVITALMVFSLVTHASCQSHTGSGVESVNPGTGISGLKMVFEPGLSIDGEMVKKTFQPSYVVTSKGTLLVFCQGRLKAGDDNDPKVILMNKSFDYGQTWEGVEVLSAPMNHFAISPYTALVDGIERISFLTCVGLKVTKKYYGHDIDKMKKETGIDLHEVGLDKAAVLCRYFSDDDGVTWSLETLTGDNTPLYKDYMGFTPVFINTIGQVHTITEGPYAGRFILAGPVYAATSSEPPTDNFRNHPCTGSGVMYSDDQGVTWRMDGMITDYIGNEASAVSIEGGQTLLMIRRLNDPDRYKEYPPVFITPVGSEKRLAHKSDDGGSTWCEPFLVDVSEVMCHGTLAKVNNRLYFSIPAGLDTRDQPKKRWDDDRVRGAIYYSDDDGDNWAMKIIEPEYFSYSTVGVLNDQYLITFFSRGGHGRFGIGYRIFTDDWLDDR